MKRIVFSEDIGGAWIACARTVVWEEVEWALRDPQRCRLLIHHPVPKQQTIIIGNI